MHSRIARDTPRSAARGHRAAYCAACVDSHCPFDSAIEGTSISVLDVVTSRSTDGERLFVKAVNASREYALRTAVAVIGTMVGAEGTVQTLTGDSLGSEQLSNASRGDSTDGVAPHWPDVHDRSAAAFGDRADV